MREENSLELISQLSTENQGRYCSKEDIKLLVLHSLDIDRNTLYRENPSVDKVQLKKIVDFIERRNLGEPLAYILGTKGFWNLDFFIDENVLVPRPETELMVEKIVEIFKYKNIFILDVGTGSGCILLSILSELKNSSGIGLDISKQAIRVAKANSEKSKLTGRTKFLNRCIDDVYNKKFDLIVSNPPYIKRKELKNLVDDIKKFEPKLALDGGNDGLDVIKKVIYKSRSILKIKGMLALEIGNEQFKKVSKILRSNKFKTRYLVNDYRTNIRCILSTLEN